MDADLAAALLSISPDQGTPSTVGPLVPLARYLEAEQRLGRVRSDVDIASAALALLAVPFTVVTLDRLSHATGTVGEIDMVGPIDVVLGGILPRDQACEFEAALSRTARC